MAYQVKAPVNKYRKVVKISFKISIIGCGSIANAMHGPAYLKYARENKEAELSACCDIDIRRAEAFKRKFGFKNAYTHMDEMLDKEKPDAVSLISPVQLTAELAGKILERGIPLLLEKPPARTKGELLILMEKARGVPHRVAFNRRYSPLMRELKKQLKNMDEKIQSLQYDMFRINRLDEDFSTTAIHAIDAVRFITGSDYRSIHFTYKEHPELRGRITDIHMECSMEGEAEVNLNICPVTGINLERATVNLYNNTFFMDFMGGPHYPVGRLSHIRMNEIVSELTCNNMSDGPDAFEREGFYYENKSFFDDIIAGKTPSGNLESAMQSVEVADCIRNRISEYRANKG